MEKQRRHNNYTILRKIAGIFTILNGAAFIIQTTGIVIYCVIFLIAGKSKGTFISPFSYISFIIINILIVMGALYIIKIGRRWRSHYFAWSDFFKVILINILCGILMKANIFAMPLPTEW